MPSLDFEAEKAVFRDYYIDNAQRLDQTMKAFLTLIGSLLAHAGLDVAAATGRIKDREESIKKFTRKYQGSLEASATPYAIADHITDIVGLRLVCLYEDEIDPIGQLIRDNFEVIDVTDKTAEIEGTENAFGYKGLHLDLRLNDERAAMPDYALFAPYRFELQIRTVVQDSWSTLDHKIKYKKSIPAPLKRRINTLAALFELADREFRQVREETEKEIQRAASEPEPEPEPDAAMDGDLQVEAPAEPLVDGEVPSRQFAPLDAFRLLRIARHFFPDAEFEPRKIDGFTAEVIAREPGISRGKFNHYLRTTIGMVHQYKAWFLQEGKGEKFNAFTEMRHALYAAAPDKFSGMLTNVARENFDTWRADNADQQA